MGPLPNGLSMAFLHGGVILTTYKSWEPILQEENSKLPVVRLWDEGPNWCSIIASTSDVKILVRWDAASIEAQKARNARNAALLLGEFCGFSTTFGVPFDEPK